MSLMQFDYRSFHRRRRLKKTKGELEEKNLILLLKTMSEDATLEDSWRELTEYNLGICLPD